MTTPVDTVGRFYDALGNGDVPAALSLLDAQVEWTVAERFPYYSGAWKGPQAVLDKLLKPLSGDWIGFSANTGEVQARLPLASKAKVSAAVLDAYTAQPRRASWNPQCSTRVLMKFVELVGKDIDALARLLSSEHARRACRVRELCFSASWRSGSDVPGQLLRITAERHGVKHSQLIEA